MGFMSVLLFIVGAIALIVGVGAIGFGIPINEFSFGNTLIVAGVTAAVGGLIVIGLGAVVAQLHRLREALAAGAPVRPGHTAGEFEAPMSGRMVAERVPFPVRSRPDAPVPEETPFAPAPGAEPSGEPSSWSAAPQLRNPDAPPVSVDEETSLVAPRPPHGGNGSGRGEAPHVPAPEPAGEQSWRPRQPSPEPLRPRETNFDAMWPPVGSRPAPPPAVTAEEPPAEPARATGPAEPAVEPAPARSEENVPRAAAILKSGVVDGMGYTLYVDGSIEAELPQGTLRFASINDLRSHLDKNA